MKIGRIRSRKISETIIQQNGDGLVCPRRRDDDIGKIVSVYVARGDLQPASGRCDAHGLPAASAKVKCDPVARTARTALTDVHAGKIRAVISVKISDGKMGSHLGSDGRRSCPSPRNCQERAEGYEGPKGRLRNKAFVNPRSHEIQVHNARRI